MTKETATLAGVIWLFVIAVALILYSNADAQEVQMSASVRWNNCNVLTTTHPKPLSFEVTDTGYRAEMEDGSEVIYTWINDTLLLEWEDAWAVIDETGFNWGACETR